MKKLTLRFSAVIAAAAFAMLGNACGTAAAADAVSATQTGDALAAATGPSAHSLDGVWAGSGVGTFGGQAFAFVGTFNAHASDSVTLAATLTLDTTVGPLTADCTAPYDRAAESAVATCVGSNGLTTAVHLVVTDNGREIRFWENVTEVALFATGSLRRQ